MSRPDCCEDGPRLHRLSRSWVVQPLQAGVRLSYPSKLVATTASPYVTRQLCHLNVETFNWAPLCHSQHPSSRDDTRVRQNIRIRRGPLLHALDLTISVREQLVNLVAAIRPLIRQCPTCRVNDMGTLLFCQRMLTLVALTRMSRRYRVEAWPLIRRLPNTC